MDWVIFGMNKHEGQQIMQMLIVAYPRQYDMSDDLSRQRLRKITEIIKDFDFTQLQTALDKWIKDNKYPPTFSDINHMGYSPEMKEFNEYEAAKQKVASINKIGREALLKKLRSKYGFNDE